MVLSFFFDVSHCGSDILLIAAWTESGEYCEFVVHSSMCESTAVLSGSFIRGVSSRQRPYSIGRKSFIHYGLGLMRTGFGLGGLVVVCYLGLFRSKKIRKRRLREREFVLRDFILAKVVMV